MNLKFPLNKIPFTKLSHMREFVVSKVLLHDSFLVFEDKIRFSSPKRILG